MTDGALNGVVIFATLYLAGMIGFVVWYARRR